MKEVSLFILVVSLLSLGKCVVAAEKEHTPARDAFFSSGIIPQIKIELDDDAFKSVRQNPRKNVKAAVREGDIVYRDVAVHLKGESSFEPIDEKPSLTLNFDKFVLGQAFHGLDKIHLNNSTQDPSLLCEYMGSALFQAARYPVARVSHARVKLNERDLGLYVLVEGYNKNFLRRYFKDPNGNFYDAASSQDINNPLDKTSGDGPDDYSDLQALKEAVYEQDRTKRLENLKGLLWLAEENSLLSSTPSFYTFLATEILAGHWDGYSLHRNNYRLYHDPGSGRFAFIPSGMDQLFVYPRSSLLPDCAGRVAATILDTAEGRRLLRERIQDLSKSVLRPEALHKILDDTAANLKPVIKELGPKAETTHEHALARLRRRIEERIKFLETELSHKPITPQFDPNGVAQITGWQAYADLGIATLYATNRVSDASTTPSLQHSNILVIHCRGREIPTAASWRARISLSKGRYRLQGRLTTTDLRALPNRLAGGARIRVFGEPLPAIGAVGKDGWQEFSTEFAAVADGEDREIICEARAFLGVCHFDLNSLKLLSVAD